MGPGPRDPEPPQSLKMGPRTSPRFKSGTPGPPCQSLKVGPQGTLSKFQKETYIMVFPHCFTYYILYGKLRNFFQEIIFHEFSWCPYGPLNKVLCFKLISPGCF